MENFIWTDKKFIDYNFVMDTELKNVSYTQSVSGDNSIIVRNAINLLLRMSYFIDEKNISPNTPQGWFQLHAFSIYSRLAYAIKIIFELWLRDYYQESSVLLRHILEGFVQVRYFYNHPDKVELHLTSTRNRDRIKFKDMFEECAVGSYEKIYGDLSNFAHSGLGSLMTRMEVYTDSSKNRVKVGCEFDKTLADYIIEQIIDYCYGYINYADVFFPSMIKEIQTFSDSSTTEEILTYRDMFLQEIKNRLNKPLATKNQQDFFDNIMKPLIEK